MMLRPSAWLLLGALLFAAAGCDKDKDAEPPAELVDLKPTISVQRLWSTGIGGGAEVLRLSLGIAADAGRLFTASHEGEVYAIAPDSGRVMWKADTKAGLSAGPGAGGGIVVVGANDGDVIALDAASGKPRWRVKVSGEVLGAPLVADDLVVVRSVDGRLRALAVADGKERWVVEELVPRLTLRGTSSPVRSGELVICGFDNGKVMAVTLAAGDIVWQTQVSTPRGRSELERLADVDAAVQVAGDDVYAVGFQGRIVMMARDSGQIWWGREVSSYRGLALDEDRVYVAGSTGDVVALNRRDGSILWLQEGLKRRRLGAPAADAAGVVVGDLEGYVHWLDRESGRFVAREHPGGARISAAPVVLDGRVFVIDDAGKIVAFRTGPAPGA